MSGFLADLAWTGFRLTFGLSSLAGVWVTAVVKNGALWASDTAEEKRDLALAQEQHWSLTETPLPGFRHAFFQTRLGTSIHYVTNTPADGSSRPKNVAVFIHGFPDSLLLWRHVLQSPELYRDHILIAVDLPGYGGSDSLPSYGPYEMLEAITEFILGMREQFLQSDMKTVVVAHDWGAIIAARLACEASELADYWVIMSGMIPTLARSNAQAQMALAKKMLHTWIRSPSNFRLLRTAFEAVGPLRSQFSHSFYIFCFLLPWPFGNMLATFGNFWLLRVMHSLGKGGLRKGGKIIGRLGPKEAGEAMAMSTGPGLQQLDGATSSSLRYGESVRRRVADRGMSEKVKIYRDNLFAGKWDKSLETTAALVNIASSKPRTTTSSGPLIHGLKDGRYLKAPITFLLGERDPAFNKRVVLDNFKDIMHGGGQVVTIKNAGHWLPLEAESRRVVERTVAWVLRSGEQGYIPFAEMSSVNTVTEV